MPLSIGIAASAGSLKNKLEPAALGYRVNLLPNPSLETNTATYTLRGSGTTISRSTDESFTGDHSLKVNLGIGAAVGAFFSEVPNRYPIQPKSYYFSAYVKLISSDNNNRSMRLRWFAYEFQTTGTNVQSASGTSVSCVSGEWTRLSMLVDITASNANYITLIVERPTSADAGDIIYIDSLLFEDTATLGSYFDGDSGFWVGTEHGSISAASPY
jgi:hypothetical protein